MTSFNPDGQENPIPSLSDLQFGTAWAGDDSAPVAGRERSGGAVKQRSRPTARRPRADNKFVGGRARQPNLEPVDFTVDFYPQDQAFAPLAEIMRKSARTYEMFRVARTFLEEPNRFVFVIKKNPEAGTKFYSNPFDDLPFCSRDNLLNHLIRNHLDRICTTEIRTVDPPKGNFTVIHRCPFTGRLIAATNYHRHHQLLRDHFLLHVRRMAFEKFCEKLETTRDPADIHLWIEEMARQKVYRPLEAGLDLQFESLDELRAHIEKHRPDLVREVSMVRIAGTSLDQISEPAIRDAVLLQLKRQLKFPLETVNGMRNKLKSAGLHVYKRGKRGVSFVCSIRRRFRDGQTSFSPSLQLLIDRIEANPRLSVPTLWEQLSDRVQSKDALLQDLAWLIREGYVSEFEDGSLQTYPPLPTQRADRTEEEAADGDRVQKNDQRKTTEGTAAGEDSRDRPSGKDQDPAEDRS